MQHIRLITIGILLMCSSVDSVSIGRVNNTRFTSIDHLNTGSIWLFNLTTSSQCLCEVLSSNYSSTAIALNMYRNGSCQLFTTLPYTFTLEINPNSSLILLKPLPPRNLAPCCSNISWLINQINASQQASTNLYRSGYVIIDDNNYLVVLSYKVSFIQYNRTTSNIIRNITSVAYPTSLNYRNGFYYIPSGTSPPIVYAISSSNLSIIANISLPTNGTIREITFIRNNSLMLIAAYTSNQILFYDVHSTKNYTPSTPSSISATSPCGLYAVNDSFIYVASWASSQPVHTLIYSNNTWNLSPLINTTTNGSEQIFQTKVDSCGRLWLGITGFGIRIFDPWGRSLLYEWPVESSMDGFLLLNNYELFVTDFTGNKTFHYNPNITQCTS